MGALLSIGFLMVVAGGLIRWACHAYVPLGNPDQVRIITEKGEATDTVVKTGTMFLWLKGWITGFLEVPRRFDVEVKEFEFILPNDETLNTSLTLLFEIADDGGRKFVKNGGWVGVATKSSRIARTTIERFSQDKNERPQTADEAQMMHKEFILRAADALILGDLCDQASQSGDREKFINELVIKLAENDGEYPVTQFGVVLVGLNMDQFVESKVVTEAAAEKKAASIRNEQKKAETNAFKERMEILKEGHDNVSFKDATLAAQILDGTVKHTISEQIVRVIDDGTGDGVGKLIGGIIAAAQAHNGAGGKGNGSSKKTAP